ncbi:MAG TPA: long-chain fatty acid--CoA ligase [Actinomycetota bacterium]|nr:long-chain fatty acid--CoA ligase [Actinomycetota bacterium]
MTDHRPWFRVWREGVPKSVAPFPRQSVFNLLADSAAGFPGTTAIAFLGKHMTYAQLLEEVERFSAVLAGLGVGRGDRVGLLLPNSPQYVIAWYACQRLGAIAIGNNPLYTQRELAHQIKDFTPSVMVILDQLYPAWTEVEHESPVAEVVVTKITDYMRFPLNVLAPLKFKREAKHEGKPWPPVPSGARVRWWKEAMKAAGTPPPVAEVDAEHDPATLVYTGGTTGLSKGAMLSHHNITSNVRQVVPCINFFERGRDGVMCILPFFHSFGLVAMNFGIAQAGKLVLLPRFEVKMALKELDKEKPTFFPGVPRLFVALNEAPETPKYDLKSVKACISGAAPLPRAVAERFHEVTNGANLVEGYGLTETSPVTHVNPFDEPKHGTIGLPIPDTDCRLVSLDDPDTEVPAGERGELCIKGPQVMLGYWNKPEATAEMIRGDWLHTGDIAVMDDEGFFQIVDRMKDMIIVSGFNVYPTEVEAVIYRHPKVLKACVVGLPDDTTGERVKAYVVAKDGETLTGEELAAWCRDPAQGLTGYRAPKEWEFRDELPETLIGKVLRRVLQEEERQKAAAGS